MKRTFTWMMGLTLAALTLPASALPQHGVHEAAESEATTAHRIAAEPKTVRPQPKHLHTINGRNRSLGRMEAPPAPGQGRQITVRSTAYCLRGLTARGTSVEYGTVAVDPRVIPMGSRIYIPGYGWGRALDTGGAIRGNIVDVWLPTLSQCYQWGHRTVTITVLDR